MERLSYECDYLLGEMLIEYSPGFSGYGEKEGEVFLSLLLTSWFFFFPPPLWVFSLGLQMRMEIGDVDVSNFQRLVGCLSFQDERIVFLRVHRLQF